MSLCSSIYRPHSVPAGGGDYVCYIAMTDSLHIKGYSIYKNNIHVGVGKEIKLRGGGALEIKVQGEGHGGGGVTIAIACNFKNNF